MPLIAGVVRRTDAPLAPGLVASLASGVLDAVQDEVGSVTVITGGRPPFHTRPLTRPYERDGFVVSWSGRLDNLAECARRCGLQTARVEDVTLTLYERWGTQGFVHLVGDFALAVWDSRERRLVLAVDAPGRAPLYYRAAGEHVVWGPSARRLAAALAPGMALNEDYVGSFLINRPSVESPFAGIAKVPPASAVVIGPGGIEVRPYWTPETSEEIRYRTDREYEEHFLAVFADAVACRLPDDGAVACELSGGVDSSTIVCTADRLIEQRNVRCPGMVLLSYVFEDSKGSDERRYMDSVRQGMRWPSFLFSERDCPLLTRPPSDLNWDEPTGQLLFLSRQDRVAEVMADCGAQVLLSGIGGDQLFWSEPPPALPLADLLRQGRLRAVHRGCTEWARTLGWSYRRTLWQGAIGPLLPRRWQRARERRVSPLADWFARDFVRRARLNERRGGDFAVTASRPSQAAQCAILRHTMRPYALQRLTRDGAADVRYPYLDRRLVEFALRLPLDQSIRPSETRSIVRRAFRGSLPETIRARRTKGGPDEALLRAFTRERRWLDELFTDARTVRLGFVDPFAARRALQLACHGSVRSMVQLMKTIALEIWLRSLDSHSPGTSVFARPSAGANEHSGARHRVAGT